MWGEGGDEGSLTYTFVEVVKYTYPFYTIRLLGGLLYLGGMFVMAYNVLKTVAGQDAVNAPIPAVAAAHA